MFGNFGGDAQASVVARGAVGEIDAGEVEQRVLGCFRFRFRCWGRNAEEVPAAGQVFLFGAAGEESGVTDAFERGWNGMKQETADEFVGGEGHGFFPILVAAVPVGEGDLACGDIEDSMIGDGDAVGVASEVIQDDLGSGESRFGIDDPIRFVERTATGLEKRPYCRSSTR